VRFQDKLSVTQFTVRFHFP